MRDFWRVLRTRDTYLLRCKWDSQDAKWRVFIWPGWKDASRKNFRVNSRRRRRRTSPLSLPSTPSCDSRSFREIKQLIVACPIIFFALVVKRRRKEYPQPWKSGTGKDVRDVAPRHRGRSSAASLTSTPPLLLPVDFSSLKCSRLASHAQTGGRGKTRIRQPTRPYLVIKFPSIVPRGTN